MIHCLCHIASNDTLSVAIRKQWYIVNVILQAMTLCQYHTASNDELSMSYCKQWYLVSVIPQAMIHCQYHTASNDILWVSYCMQWYIVSVNPEAMIPCLQHGHDKASSLALPIAGVYEPSHQALDRTSSCVCMTDSVTLGHTSWCVERGAHMTLDGLLQHTVGYYDIQWVTTTHRRLLQHTVGYYNTQEVTTTHRRLLQHTVSYCVL